jgi:hypothetical protein
MWVIGADELIKSMWDFFQGTLKNKKKQKKVSKYVNNKYKGNCFDSLVIIVIQILKLSIFNSKF